MAEITICKKLPVADKVYLPRLSVMVPVRLPPKVTLTIGIAWPVPASVITPLTVVRCAKQPRDTSRHPKQIRNFLLKKGK